METQTFEVDAYRGDREMKAVLHGDGFTLEVVNSVGGVAIDMTEDGRINIGMNETSVRFVPPWTVDIEEMDPAMQGTIRVHTTGEKGFLEGTYENLPIYAPYYAYHADTDNVYAIDRRPSKVEADAFLGISPVEDEDANYYTVEDVDTGQNARLRSDTIQERFDNGELTAVAPFSTA